MLGPVLFYNVVVGVIFYLQFFEQAFVITSKDLGAPVNSTLYYTIYLYQNAFDFLKMGYAAAMAWVLFLTTLAVTVLFFAFQRRLVLLRGRRLMAAPARSMAGTPGARRRQAGRWGRRGLVQVTLIVTSVIFLLPLVWMYRARSRATPTSFVFPPVLFPAQPQTGNYAQALSYIPFGTYFRNSAIVSAATVVGTLVACVPPPMPSRSCAGPGETSCSALVLATIMLPFPWSWSRSTSSSGTWAGSGRCSP